MLKPRRWLARPESTADLAFAVLVVVAAPIIALTNPGEWFQADEVVFFFRRDLAEPGSWFRPHWGHLTALPVVVFQVLYKFTGLVHYWPYQWLAICTHLLLAVLVRVVMKRSGVTPWLSTAALAPFLFLGSGRQNLTWGFQVTLTGALAFAFGALVVLIGERGRSKRSSAIAGGLLVGSVLCSNTGMVMVGVIGSFLVLRTLVEVGSDWRATVQRLLAVLGPAATVFFVWSALAPPSELNHDEAGASLAVDFAGRLVEAAVQGYSQSLLLGAILAVVAVLGVGHGVREMAATRDPGHGGAVAVALLAGTTAMALVIGIGRALDPEVGPSTTRYVYVIVALALVPLAVGLQQVIRRLDEPIATAALVLLVVGLPGNLELLSPPAGRASGRPAEFVRMAEMVVESDLADDEQIWAGLDAGDFRRFSAQGLLPQVSMDSEDVGRATLKVTLSVGGEPGDHCEALDPEQATMFDVGDTVRFTRPISISYASADGPRGEMTVGTRLASEVLRIRHGPVKLWISSSEENLQRCR